MNKDKLRASRSVLEVSDGRRALFLAGFIMYAGLIKGRIGHVLPEFSPRIEKNRLQASLPFGAKLEAAKVEAGWKDLENG